MKKKTNQLDSQGERHGIWKEYRPNCTVWWRRHYHHGKAYGLWEYYWGDDIPGDKVYHLNIK